MFETTDLNEVNLNDREIPYGKVFCQTLHMHGSLFLQWKTD